MRLKLASLLTDTLVIEEIVIRGPVVTYELAGLRSNVGSLLDALRSGKERPESTKTPGSKGKKVIIDHFLFEDGRVRLATTLTGGRGVVLPLPKIEMRDIGRRQEGVKAVGGALRSFGGLFGGKPVEQTEEKTEESKTE